MPKKRKLNHKLIKSTQLYFIDELAETLGVHQNTISNMKKAGMPIVEGSYPNIIRGAFAIAFIKERQTQSEKKLKQDEFLCFGCGRKASKAKDCFATLEITAPKTGNLKANCHICGTKLNRKISLKDLPKFQEVLKIITVLNPRLIEGFNNSGICETEEVIKND